MVLMLLVRTFIKTGNPHFFKCVVRLSLNYFKLRINGYGLLGIHILLLDIRLDHDICKSQYSPFCLI